MDNAKSIGISFILPLLYLGVWVLVYADYFLFQDFSIGNKLILFCPLLLFSALALGGTVGLLIKREIVIKIIRFDLKYVFQLITVISFFGLYRLITAVDLFSRLNGSELHLMRELILNGDIKLNSGISILFNFIYPLSSMFPFLLLKMKNRFWKWLLSMGLLAVVTLFTLSTGGKGSLFYCMVLSLFSIVYITIKKKWQIRIHFKNLSVILLILTVVFITFNFISNSRNTDSEDKTYIHHYFSGPLVGLMTLVQYKSVPLVGFDISDHSIWRTCNMLRGETGQWKMDKNIVYIPDKINVFTGIADPLYALGIIGTYVYYVFIGFVMVRLSRGSFSINKGILFSLLGLFVSFSFFVDVSFFLAGFWYLVIFSMVPLK